MPKPLDELLAEALEIPAGPQRDAWIEIACGAEARLRDELRKLLAAAQSAPPSFLTPLVEPGRQSSMEESE